MTTRLSHSDRFGDMASHYYTLIAASHDEVLKRKLCDVEKQAIRWIARRYAKGANYASSYDFSRFAGVNPTRASEIFSGLLGSGSNYQFEFWDERGLHIDDPLFAGGGSLFYSSETFLFDDTPVTLLRITDYTLEYDEQDDEVNELLDRAERGITGKCEREPYSSYDSGQRLIEFMRQYYPVLSII